MALILVFLKDAQSLIKDFFTFLSYQQRSSSCTVRAYNADLQQFLLFWQKENSVRRTKMQLAEAVNKFLLSLFYNTSISASTIARKISCFKSLQKFLSNKGISFSVDVKYPKVSKKLPTVLSETEILFLLEEVPSLMQKKSFPLRNQALVEVLYSTGLRCSELVNLRVQDVDLEDGVIRVEKGKGSRDRIVVFGSYAKKKLEQYLQSERLVLASFGCPIYLFLGRGGHKLSTRYIQLLLQEMRAYLPSKPMLTPHVLRHSFATHLLNNGASLRIVQQLLGHQRIKTTELYTQVSQKELATFLEENHPIQKMLKSL